MNIVIDVGFILPQRCHVGAVDLSIFRMLIVARFDLLETNEIVKDGDDRTKYYVEFGTAIRAERSLKLAEKNAEIGKIFIFVPFRRNWLKTLHGEIRDHESLYRLAWSVFCKIVLKAVFRVFKACAFLECHGFPLRT